MKPVVHLIHGFTLCKPARTVGKLAPYFPAGGYPAHIAAGKASHSKGLWA